MIEMHFSIGRHLGNLLAHAEHDSGHDPSDLEALERIRLISEAYRNFANPEFGTFKNDFQEGYEIGATNVRKFFRTEPTRDGEKAAPGGDGPNLG